MATVGRISFTVRSLLDLPEPEEGRQEEKDYDPGKCNGGGGGGGSPLYRRRGWMASDSGRSRRCTGECEGRRRQGSDWQRKGKAGKRGTERPGPTGREGRLGEERATR